MIISVGLICLTAIIIAVLIINYKKSSHLSVDSFKRIDERYNDINLRMTGLEVNNPELLHKEYKEIKESLVLVNQQIQSFNTKMSFSNLRNQVNNNG